MVWPKLIPPALCTTAAKVRVDTGGTDEDGAPVPALTVEAACNYQSGGRVVLTADKREVQIAGVCLFDGDIAPDLPELTSGTVEVAGGVYKLFRGSKARNPDGTVNYTRLELE